MVYQPSSFPGKSTQNGLLHGSAARALSHLMVQHQDGDKHHRVFQVFAGKQLFTTSGPGVKVIGCAHPQVLVVEPSLGGEGIMSLTAQLTHLISSRGVQNLADLTQPQNFYQLVCFSSDTKILEFFGRNI